MFDFLKKIFVPAPVVVAIPKPVEAIPQIKDEVLPQPNERVVHLGIVVGHTKKEGGAKLCTTKMSEYEYSSKVLESLIKQSKDYPSLKVSGIFRDEVGIHGAYAKAKSFKCDAVVELHFNAFNGSQRGSQTLCTPDKND